jgi:hypothetical protein
LRPPKGVPTGRCPSQKEPLTCQVPSQGAPSICDHPMVTQPVGVQRESSSARGNNMAECAACDALCCYGCGPKRKSTRWAASKTTIALHLRYYQSMVKQMSVLSRSGPTRTPVHRLTLAPPLNELSDVPMAECPVPGASSGCGHPRVCPAVSVQ